jgi:hypothetical protein
LLAAGDRLGAVGQQHHRTDMETGFEVMVVVAFDLQYPATCPHGTYIYTDPVDRWFYIRNLGVSFRHGSSV